MRAFYIRDEVDADETGYDWDDELAALPEESRRRVALRRGAYFALVAGLVTLIILTIVFVGPDTNSAKLSTAAAGAATSSTVGFAVTLPAAATATSLSDGTATTGTTASSTTTSTTVKKGTTTTSTAPTTTTPPPPFRYTVNPKHATIMGINNCAFDPAGEQFTFSAPAPGGTLTISRSNPKSVTVSGPVNPDGTFDISNTAGGTTEHYSNGRTTQTGAKADFTHTEVGCSYTISLTWTFA